MRKRNGKEIYAKAFNKLFSSVEVNKAYFLEPLKDNVCAVQKRPPLAWNFVQKPFLLRRKVLMPQMTTIKIACGNRTRNHSS